MNELKLLLLRVLGAGGYLTIGQLVGKVLDLPVPPGCRAPVWRENVELALKELEAQGAVVRFYDAWRIAPSPEDAVARLIRKEM